MSDTPIAELACLGDRRERWVHERDAIRRAVLEEGVSLLGAPG